MNTEPDTTNVFLVGVLDDTIIISGLSPRRLSRPEALNLAAWLLAVADHGAWQGVTMPILSGEFLRLLSAVQET